MKKSEIQIKPFKNPSGETAWRVSGIVNGQRRRQNFPKDKHAEAMTVKQNWEREVLNMVPLPAVTTRLTADQAGEGEACYRRIAGSQITSLTQAVEFALSNYRPATNRIKVAPALEQFIEDKRTTNKRAATLEKLKQKTAKLKNAHGGAFVHEITTEQLRALIFRAGCGLVTQDTDYRTFTNFFNWALAKKYCSVSPMAGIEKITLETGEPKILKVGEARRLLAAAVEFKNGLLVPYVTLALFAAIRPLGEMGRLSWDDINFKTQMVKVNGKVRDASGRSRRLTKLPDNAVEFLLPHATKKTPFIGPNFWKHFYAVRALAGITEWPQDVLRHTGISFHLAKYEHEGKTAAWAGNSPDIVQDVYKGLIDDPADVEAFYSITPETLASPIVKLTGVEQTEDRCELMEQDDAQALKTGTL